MYPYTSLEWRTMLFRVASLVRVGSGGKGPPRREGIFSRAAASESESKAESQAADDCLSSAISSGLEVAAGRVEGRPSTPLQTDRFAPAIWAMRCAKVSISGT